MKCSEGTFRTFDGIELFRREWRPESEARAVVAIVHGVGEHSGRFEYVAEHMTARGFVVRGFDHRGHGRSPGRRAHVDEWADYRKDVRAFLESIDQGDSDKPLFLMGHSMGGLIALDYVLRQPDGLTGAIASAPALEPADMAGPILLGLVRVLSRVWPRFPLSQRLDPTLLSNDPEAVEAYRNDPLVHLRATPRWVTEIFSAIEWVNAHADDMRLPLLMLHGEDDPICKVEGSKQFFDRVTYPDKTLHLYPNTRHEPHQDLCREQVLKDMINWLGMHL